MVRQVCNSFWKLALRVLITFDMFLLKDVEYLHLSPWRSHKNAVMLDKQWLQCGTVESRYWIQYMVYVSVFHVVSPQRPNFPWNIRSHFTTEHPFSIFPSMHSACESIPSCCERTALPTELPFRFISQNENYNNLSTTGAFFCNKRVKLGLKTNIKALKLQLIQVRSG